MKKRIAVASVVLIAVAFSMAPVVEGASSTGRNNVIWLDDSSAVKGAFSRLWRNDDGVAMRLKSRKLPMGTYTVWWVFWDNPENCATPLECGSDDFGSAEAGSDVTFATGHIIASPKGRFKAAAGLSKGAAGLLGGTFDNPHTAEVHLIVQYHGSVDPDAVHLQTQSPPGQGCNPDCSDLQGSIHRAN